MSAVGTDYIRTGLAIGRAPEVLGSLSLVARSGAALTCPLLRASRRRLLLRRDVWRGCAPCKGRAHGARAKPSGTC